MLGAEKDIVRDAAVFLMDTADKLEKWAAETQTGGWSTHLVQPLRDQAQKHRVEAARLMRLIV